MLKDNRHLFHKPRVNDAEDMMIGTCLTCWSVMERVRWKCEKSRNPNNDAPIAECLTCKAKCIGQIKSGTIVYMVKKI